MNFKFLLTVSFICFSFFTKGQFERYLVGHYPFEDGRAKDYSRRGGSGEIYGNLQTIKGINGDALRFNGTDESIVFDGRINRYLRGKNDFTISFYFRSDDLNQRSSLMGKRARCKGARIFDLLLSKRKLVAELNEKESRRTFNNTTVMISDGGWHHYVYVRRGNTVGLFVDGKLKDQSRISRIIPIDDLAYFAINASPCKEVDGTGNLIGAIDELKIFRVALSKKHVRYLFEQIPLPILQVSSTPPTPRKKSLANKPSRANSSADKLAPIFGSYIDLESQSSFVLNANKFILTIKNPNGYEAKELIYEGKYKIEAGDLYLLKGTILLKNASGETYKKVEYKEKIIGDLYKNGVDFFAFETRMKLKK